MVQPCWMTPEATVLGCRQDLFRFVTLLLSSSDPHLRHLEQRNDGSLRFCWTHSFFYAKTDHQLTGHILESSFSDFLSHSYLFPMFFIEARDHPHVTPHAIPISPLLLLASPCFARGCMFPRHLGVECKVRGVVQLRRSQGCSRDGPPVPGRFVKITSSRWSQPQGSHGASQIIGDHRGTV